VVRLLPAVLEGAYTAAAVTMGRAALNNGQALYAVNDFFIGQRTHTSARYTLRYRDQEEDQSSSGIIVSTGAGSTGWFRSVLAGAAGVTEGFASAGNQTNKLRTEFRFPWDAGQLCFSVREPFTSKTSGAEIVFGRLERGEDLVITSQMPRNGIVFSDGVEADGLEFISGGVLRVGVADKTLRLITAVGRTTTPEHRGAGRVR
jgi:hypothetical protein